MEILPRIDIDGPPTDEHISVDYYYLYLLGGGDWFSQWQMEGEYDGRYKVTVTSLDHQIPDDIFAVAYGECYGSIKEALNDALPASLHCQEV